MNVLQRTFFALLVVGVCSIRSETTYTSEILTYLNVLTCAVNVQPWECVYQRSGRVFDSIQESLQQKEIELKEQADSEYLAKLAARGFSETEITEKDKPSTVLSTLENYVTNGFKKLMAEVRGEDKLEERKMKKKPQIQLVQYQKPEIYELAEMNEHSHGHGGHGGGHGGLGHHGGLGLHKKKYGRSIGGKRGKGKKKKRKALMKLLLIGAVLKAKIELLLKLIATHLQIKFFFIAVVGLIVNIARFWVDLKRGHQPQKVVYYEQAHHQHVYDEHDDGWGSGSYWKRSLATPYSDSSSAETIPTANQVKISYDRVGNLPPSSVFSPNNYRTYNEQISGYTGSSPSGQSSSGPQLSTFTEPHSIVYSQQMPQQTYSFN